ncbi:hypothetical protein Tco_1009905, partial [Tanacetum coccineum]
SIEPSGSFLSHRFAALVIDIGKLEALSNFQLHQLVPSLFLFLLLQTDLWYQKVNRILVNSNSQDCLSWKASLMIRALVQALRKLEEIFGRTPGHALLKQRISNQIRCIGVEKRIRHIQQFRNLRRRLLNDPDAVAYGLRHRLHGYVRFGNQSIEHDRLSEIEFVLDFMEFISFTFDDKEMILWFKRFSD